VELLPSLHALPSDIDEWCAARLAPYKRPTTIRVLAALPAASTGKVLKHKLRDEL
jgi:long-chain acyl-CoA synthetase